MSRKRRERPNVVVFFTDQQRWDSTGLHGNPLDLTPNLDRLALEGVHLASTFTCQPVCGPARACLQTGMYPTTLGTFCNGIPLPGGSTTLAHCFGEAGYDTAYIGKRHLADVDPVPCSQQGGYQYWLAANVPEFVSDAYNAILFDAEGRPVRLPGYRVDALTDAAIRYVDAHQERPFYLNLVGLDSHREVAEVMRERLIRRMVEAGEEAPEIVPAPSRPGGQKRVSPEEVCA